MGDEKPVVEEELADSNKETPANEAEEKEPEDKVDVCNFFNPKYFVLDKIHLLFLLFFGLPNE